MLDPYVFEKLPYGLLEREREIRPQGLFLGDIISMLAAPMKWR